ncbi:MAG TPA: CoA-binding protein [Candidatus Kapabacteria bacterium]|nr:CoA-binding protein [Candidatus Kapabacteria bacterium]
MAPKDILKAAKTIAVVGLSDDPSRASFGVADLLKRLGYTIIPVNPRIKDWCGIPAYPYVSSIPEEIDIDIVDVFRRSNDTIDVVKDVLKRQNKPKCIWLQLGITNEESKRLTEEAGIEFVEDLCTAIEVRFM